MRLLILQGSFRQDKGITGMIVDKFVTGMKKANPSIDIFMEHLAGKNIRNCRGCLNCWVKTPGLCCIKDDMKEIIEEYISADVIIVATPVYIDSMSSYTKKVWERFLPVMEPYFECSATGVKHRMRSIKPKSLFLISTCAMPELKHFDPLIQTFQKISHNFEIEFLGQMLRPESHSLTYIKKYEDKIKDVLDGIEKCGEEFIQNFSISEQALSKAQQSIMESPQDFVRINNKMWDGIIGRTV
jgi:multimeric flavodoxin WrbA